MSNEYPQDCDVENIAANDTRLPDEDQPIDPYELDAETDSGRAPDEQVDWDQPLIQAPQVTSELEMNTIGGAAHVPVEKGKVATPAGIAGERSGIKAFLGNSRVWLLLGGAAVVLMIGAMMLSGGAREEPRPVGEPVTALEASTSESLRDGGNPGTSQTHPTDDNGRLEAGRAAGSSTPSKSPNPLTSPTPQPSPAPPVAVRSSSGTIDESGASSGANERISKGFIISTRAGEQAAALRERQAQESALSKVNDSAAQGTGSGSSGVGSSPIKKPQPVPLADLVKGQRIMLYTIEPLRTGVATVIQAQVLKDVRDKTGNIIFPVGTIAMIPMAAIEANGRAIMVPDGVVVFQTSKGEYGATGELKGSETGRCNG